MGNSISLEENENEDQSIHSNDIETKSSEPGENSSNNDIPPTNASVSESVSESIHAQATASKIKKRKQTVRNLKASKKAGKTKSNKRILKEYQSRYINGEKEREQRATSTLLNSD